MKITHCEKDYEFLQIISNICEIVKLDFALILNESFDKKAIIINVIRGIFNNYKKNYYIRLRVKDRDLELFERLYDLIKDNKIDLYEAKKFMVEQNSPFALCTKHNVKSFAKFLSDHKVKQYRRIVIDEFKKIYYQIKSNNILSIDVNRSEDEDTIVIVLKYKDLYLKNEISMIHWDLSIWLKEEIIKNISPIDRLIKLVSEVNIHSMHNINKINQVSKRWINPKHKFIHRYIEDYFKAYDLKNIHNGFRKDLDLKINYKLKDLNQEEDFDIIREHCITFEYEDETITYSYKILKNKITLTRVYNGTSENITQKHLHIFRDKIVLEEHDEFKLFILLHANDVMI